MKPYTENKTNNDLIFERIFSDSVTQSELVWHQDPEDRKVISIEPTDWMIQLDNKLPVDLNNEVFIPKNTFHRLIKGTGELKIMIKKQF